MRVYHFISEKHAIESLENKRLKVSIIDKLNDPFEFHPGFSEPNTHMINIFLDWKTSISKDYGILCFSKKWYNPLLWSHYAQKHTGFALGFEIQNEKAIEVKYSKNRPLWKWEKLPKHKSIKLDFLNKLIMTKFESWSYEEEIRLCYELNKLKYENGLFFNEFDENLVLKEVILGCNSTMKDKDFSSIIKGYSNVTVIKSRMDLKRFKIVNDRIKFSEDK